MATNMSANKDLINYNQHLSQLNALYSITRIINGSFGQRRMLQEVLDVLSEELELCRGVIMLSTISGSELIVEATADKTSNDPKFAARYRRGEGISGRVLETGKPVIVPKIADEPEFRGRIHQRSKESSEEYGFICVPIELAGEVVGTLSVDVPYHNKDFFKETQQTLTIVAGMVSNDVKNRRESMLAKQDLTKENQRLREALIEKYRPENFVGNSSAMSAVFQKIHQVAGSETTVLIRGESGTGKELVASAIHYSSKRKDQPFVKVNCAALSDSLLESELFGHEKGAFTGATQTRIGRLEEALGGTIFLDEIGDFSAKLQVKFLRVLQEKEFQRVGSNTTIHANVRIVAATNRDLEKLVEENKFRKDFYYRINVFGIFLPPLRERKDDILPLADAFLERFAEKMEKPVRRITTAAINMMMAYHWPGNVRELENCIEHAVLLSDDGVIHGYHLPPTLQIPGQGDLQNFGTLKSRVSLLEKDMIIDSLKRNAGKISICCSELGITARMLRYKIKNLDIDHKKYQRKYKNLDE